MTETISQAGEPSSKPSEPEVTDGPWNLPISAFVKKAESVIEPVKEAVTETVKAVTSSKPWEMSMTELMDYINKRNSGVQTKAAVEAYKAPEAPVPGIKQGLYHSPDKHTPEIQKLKKLFDEKLIIAESQGKHYLEDGKTLVKSKVGALGISQLMPDTAAKPGYGIKPLQDQSEEEYRRLGFDLLTAYNKKYKGDVRKALAAYNFGPGNVDKIVNKARREGVSWERKLPKETRDYLQKIIGK